MRRQKQKKKDDLPSVVVELSKEIASNVGIFVVALLDTYSLEMF